MHKSQIRNLSKDFHPKTIYDLLISPFTNCCLKGNKTAIFNSMGNWYVRDISEGNFGFDLETHTEEEAVNLFWKL